VLVFRLHRKASLSGTGSRYIRKYQSKFAHPSEQSLAVVVPRHVKFCFGERGEVGAELDNLEREALLHEVSEQNSRLQRLIDAIVQLVTRSRDVLRLPRPEDSPPADDGNPPAPS
jgi:hypothetical protein